jgi:crossover junction endodeoxyribonuclease RuvC
MAVAGHGAAAKDQVARMVQRILDLAEPPTPDDAADALAVAVWAAHRVRPGERSSAPVLDRAAVAPLEGGLSPYDRAVRDALRRERASTAPASRAPKAAAPKAAAPKAAAPKASAGP